MKSKPAHTHDIIPCESSGLAYEIYETDGQPISEDLEYWLFAEQMMLEDPDPARPPIKPVAASPPHASHHAHVAEH
jgi:hypothetical protein